MTRGLATMAFAAAFGLVPAQPNWVDTLRTGVRVAAERRLLRMPTNPLPLDPSGELPLGEPQEAPPAEQPFFRVLHAGDQRRAGNLVKVTGGAEVEYRGYRIVAQEVEGNLETRVFEARGQVRLVGKDVVVEADRVIVDFLAKTYQAFKSNATLSPAFVQGNVLTDLHMKGETSEGSEREVRATIARLTSCTLEEDPHYEIDSRSMDVRPGKRIILRHAKFKVSGRTLFSVPYLSIPLDEAFYRYLPEIGNTPDEGWYIKSRFGVPLPGENNLDVRFDAFSKIGIGLGGDLQYQNARMNGSFSAYVLSGTQKSLQLMLNHRMNLGKNELTLDGNFQQDNYLAAPQSTISSFRAGFRVPGKNGTETRFTYLRNGSETSGFESLGQTLGISDRRVWNDRLNTNLELNVTRDLTQSSAQTAVRKEANLVFSAEQDLGRAQALLDYQRAIPIGNSSGFSGGIDRTPVFTLSSDGRRMFGPSYRGANIRSSVSWGEFVDGYLSKKTSRAYFDLDIDRPDTRGKRFSLDWGTRFKQGVYSDNTAQYVVDANSRATYRLGSDTEFNLRYGTSRPLGYTPLSIDQASRYDQVSVDLSFRPARTFLIGAETAYDIQEMARSQVPWQNVGVRTEYRPNNWFQLRTSSLYDTRDQNWSSVRLDLGYKPGATYVGIGARFDGPRHTWSNANLFVDALKTGRLKTSLLLQYNGFLQQFESRHFSFTYDLTDCYEVIFQVIDNPLGFRAGTQYGLYIRIKAFPFATPFGLGQQGQPLGIGTGRDF